MALTSTNTDFDGLDYTEYVFQNVTRYEGTRPRVYTLDPGAGQPKQVVIGYGFDITASGLEFSQGLINGIITDPGRRISEYQLNALRRFVDGGLFYPYADSPETFITIDDAALVSIFNGGYEANTSVSLTTDEMRSLYDYKINEVEGALNNILVDSTQSIERAIFAEVLYQLGQNASLPDTANIIQNLGTNPAQHAMLWAELRYDTHKQRNLANIAQGIQDRRDNQANRFGLFTDGHSTTTVGDAELKAVGAFLNTARESALISSLGIVNTGYTNNEGSPTYYQSDYDNFLNHVHGELERRFTDFTDIDWVFDQNFANAGLHESNVSVSLLGANVDSQDLIFGDINSNTYAAGAGNDFIYGAGGDDTISGDSGADHIYGDSESDLLFGNDGDDLIDGGIGDDVIAGGLDDDTLDGGIGADTYMYSKGDGDDYIIDRGTDQSEIDTLVFTDASESEVTVELMEGQSSAFVYVEGTDARIEIRDNTLIGIERFEFTDGSWDKDRIFSKFGTSIGEEIDAHIYGGILYGDGGDDRINGSQYADRLYGGEGDDTVYGRNGDDEIYGDADDDSLYGDLGEDQLYGHEGEDRLYGGEDDDELYGGIGDDTLEGGSGGDMLYGGANNDRIFGNEENDFLYGGDGDDVISGGSGDDIIDSGAGNDLMENYSDDYSISSGSGSDTYIFGLGHGNDVIFDGDYALNSDESDRIQFEANISPDNLWIFGGTGGRDLHFMIRETGESLTVGEWDLEYTSNLIEEVVFTDGSGVMWDPLDVVNISISQGIIFGSGFDETLEGALTNDVFIGLQGDDLSIGGGGSDEFIYSNGFGNDTLDATASLGTDTITIRFTSDIYEESIVGERVDNDLLLRTAAGDTLTILNLYADPKDYRLIFEDGSTWDYSRLSESINSYDDRGNLIRSSDGAITAYFAYDSNDNLLFSMDESGIVREVRYDVEDRVTDRITYQQSVSSYLAQWVADNPFEAAPSASDVSGFFAQLHQDSGEFHRQLLANSDANYAVDSDQWDGAGWDTSAVEGGLRFRGVMAAGSLCRLTNIWCRHE